MRILSIDKAAHHLDQRFHPRVLWPATDGIRRQVVFKAGLLLGVKEEGMAYKCRFLV